MGKILLINPPFNIAKSNYDTSMAVGLLNMASYLDSRGVPVEIIDGVRQSNYHQRLKSEAPNCVFAAFSVMTMQVGQALKVSQIINSSRLNFNFSYGRVEKNIFKPKFPSQINRIPLSMPRP